MLTECNSLISRSEAMPLLINYPQSMIPLIVISSTGTHSDDCESYRTVPNMTTGSEGEDQEKPRQYYPFELIPGFFQVQALVEYPSFGLAA